MSVNASEAEIGFAATEAADVVLGFAAKKKEESYPPGIFQLLRNWSPLEPGNLWPHAWGSEVVS